MNRMRPTKKYGHSLKWTKNQLFFLNHLRQQKRWVNIWNAFLMDKLQQANKGRSVGERIRLLDFIRIHKDDLLKVYQQLLLADRQQLELKAVKACQKKLTIIRANPKALLHDVNAIFTAMDQDHFLLKQGWMASMLLFGGGVEDYAEPKHPPNKLISESHTIIQDELEFILHSNNGSRAIKMNYNNYEKKIVEHYGIALTG
ncbi:hypothetical protein SERLADRAFT_412026 [Serpula lacrymans var. lacrymans S7.9]|uniref:Uncharacterized protein n=1 Tax=Serpula lacrymans var. lacrymans (strain S7.9) TaxID=578457 RepID=F8PDG5_SERL9|nr:uncharacterized protein SERLADRAFT_412026 [Serpula lacrymans var. lacrymans S7.9]EGO18786.1 hypothetical protein SERLADRAFT_412026 [Serpula lacrymans var. lacrymans S7.9]